MKKLSKYIQYLDFEYAISYSGLRGEKFVSLEKQNKAEIQRIEKEMESARYMQKTKLSRQIEALKDEMHCSRLMDKNEVFHKSTTPIYRFEKGDEAIETIFDILHTKVEDTPISCCPPTFRDAIVFYSVEGEKVGVIHICFECWRIQDENGEDFDVDYRIYPKLQEEFIRIGHPIESE